VFGPIDASAARWLAIALAFAVLYGLAGWGLNTHPFSQSLLGNVVLLTTAAAVVVTIWMRRRSWTGCQRLFWDVYAIGMAFWFFGHLGWAYGQLVQGDPSWLRWHTIFSLCGGIAPLIALIARPHRGARSFAVATTAVDLAAAGLLALFIYSYFVLVPGLVPGPGSDPQARLLVLIQANRFLQLTGLLAAVWIGRDTAWHSTYLRLAAGVAIGAVLRIGTSRAIARGEYHPGTLHDLAWILPWLCYAWAAYFAPESKREDAIEAPEAPPAIAFSALPVLLIPAIGYGMIMFEPLGAPTDSFRSLLTGVTTVGGLGLLTIRLAAQRGALQRSDSRLRLLAAATERTADMILITRADGQLEHANEAFLKALGFTRREVDDLALKDLFGVECPDLRAQIVKAVQQTGGWRGTLKRRRKDGSTFSVACTVSPLRSATGAVTHYVGVERDISEELRLRDQLVHSERLSAIGELVAGVAHEINNPLQTIVGCVELMLDERAGGSSNKRDLETVRREAARAGQIVRNLLSFVRRGAPDRVSTDLTAIVRSMVDLREYHLRQRNITIDADYAPEPLMAMVNRDEIQQLFLNLLLNAEHAIAGAGGAGTIRVTTGSARGRHFVEVADTGPGISPDLRGRIFEPFFTTKQVGEGTGLGLSISHGIAHAHGGSLDLLDAERGARFRLTLPPVSELQDGTASSTGSARGSVPAALVVDDEVPIRQLLARLLERRGYAVQTADTSAAALRLAESNHFSLVICDVRMPGLSGIELHRRFQENHGNSPRHFVFMTGDTASVDAIPLSDPQTSILPKPFTAADLDALLAKIGLPRGAN
jgi:two-component system NtrC family sensor kinase